VKTEIRPDSLQILPDAGKFVKSGQIWMENPDLNGKSRLEWKIWTVKCDGKLLDACIWLDDDRMTTHFKLAEHAQLIIFRPVAWKKVGTL
jgi:hypothetical protein